MKYIIAILAAIFKLVIEEPAVMLRLLQNYNVYNADTGEYTTVSAVPPLQIGQEMRAPWYSGMAGDRLIILGQSEAYILTT